MVVRVDLHMHSNNSDGSDSVETIIDKAVKKGLEVIAITDHDNVRGVGSALEYAKDKITVIPGMEISTFRNIEIHILGYGFDYNADIIQTKTYELLHQREIRIKNIIKKLKDQGVKISEYDIDFSCAGRLQIAKVLVKRHYATCVQDAFNKYLGPTGSCYIPSNRLKPAEGADIIRLAGGTPVLAHPEKYLNSGILEELIDTLKEHGLGGLECHYPSHSDQTTARLSAIAKEKGLMETVGSDYHGTNGVNELGCVKFEMSRDNLERLMGHPF